jgi:hypothetical protein
VWKTDKALFQAAHRYFGTWPNAIEAAGLPCVRQRQWSKEAVLEELRRWYLGYVPAAAIGYAAKHCFGSAHTAWEAAGVDPPYRKWFPQRVIEAIQDGYVRCRNVGVAGFGDRSLADAARRYFGNWAEALAAAGLPRHLAERKTRRWSRPAVIQAIRVWHQSGRPLSKVYREDRPLYMAAATYFGTWRAAVAASGFVVVRQQWTREKVFNAIQMWQQRGLPLGRIWKEDRLLFAAGIRLFGGWRNAVRAAGPLLTTDQPRVTTIAGAGLAATTVLASRRNVSARITKGRKVCRVKPSSAASSNGRHRATP